MEKNNDNLLLADFFKTLSNDTRLKILRLLLPESLSCTSICKALDLEYSLVAHQLAILKAKNFIRSERHGKEVLYFLSDAHVRDILIFSFEHVKEKH